MIKDKGNNEIAFKATEKLAEKFSAGIRGAAFEIGKLMVKDAQSAMLEEKSGTKYRRFPNRSSRRGEAPRDQFGVLRRSIDYEVAGSDRLTFGYRQSEQQIYGGFLEDPQIHDRPNIKPVGENNEKNADVIFGKAIARAIANNLIDSSDLD